MLSGVPASATTTRREELLDGLLALFLAEGFRQFTLADLAARLRCSKTTLYALGQTKEQVTVNVVRHFFRTSTDAVEARTASAASATARLEAYLRAIGRELRPASAAFMEDLGAHAAAREVYERNTELAAGRVRDILTEGVRAGEFREVDTAFVADVTASTMQRIQTGAVRGATGLHDADAYDALAALVLEGIRAPA